MNTYPTDIAHLKFRMRQFYPLDRDLSAGYSYPGFIQPGPGNFVQIFFISHSQGLKTLSMKKGLVYFCLYGKAVVA